MGTGLRERLSIHYHLVMSPLIAIYYHLVLFPLIAIYCHLVLIIWGCPLR